MEKIINSKILFKGKIFDVRELTIELSPQNVVEWEIVDKGNDSVAILPVDDQGNIILVEEYFGAVNKRLLSLPKGMPEPNETFIEAAQRELQEEIGYSGELTHLITTEISPSYLTQKTVIFFAKNLRKAKAVGDEKEYLQPSFLSLEEALSKIRFREITESRTVTAILLYKFIYG
jgi:8-oxo-dGTP pyrophosphatase MutT (NUDIX family)